jgi:uncharacterized protein (TIGR02996 family)
VNLPPELEAALLAAPDDPSPWLVASDWLMSRGDPLGELISLSRALEHESNPAQFMLRKRRRDELLRLHGEAWTKGAALDEAVWRWGFVTHARLQVEHLDAFLSSRVGRYVRELEVQGPLESLAASLQRQPLPMLTGLALRGRGRAPVVSLVSLTGPLPRLRRLALFGVEVDFTHFTLGELTDLRLRDARHPSSTPFLAGLTSEKLTHLELLLDAPLELKTAVVTRTPALSALHLEDDLADELALWAAEAPIMKQLDLLGLSGPMTDAGLDALLIGSARLHRLSIVLEGGHFSGAAKRLAYRQLPKISFHKARAPLDWWALPKPG